MPIREQALSKLLFAVRHAHRETESGRKRDNGLSGKGQLQASRLTAFLVQYHLLHAPDHLLSSPSLRCIETIAPLSERYERPIEQCASLAEQAEDESEKAFERRIEEYLESWRQSADGITVICSHGDVIPCLSERLIGVKVDLRKGGFVEFEEAQKKIKLRTVLQHVDFMPDALPYSLSDAND